MNAHEIKIEKNSVTKPSRILNMNADIFTIESQIDHGKARINREKTRLDHGKMRQS